METSQTTGAPPAGDVPESRNPGNQKAIPAAMAIRPAVPKQIDAFFYLACHFRTFFLSLVLALSLFPLPCDAATPIKVGCSLGLTGRFAVMSDALHKGFRLWQEDVNQRGGILGRSVQLLIEDDHSDPERARSIYRRFLEEDGVDFLFAPYSSLITEAVLPIAEKHRVPILIAGAAADRLWEKGMRHAVGIYTPASKFTVGFLELLVWEGLDRIAVVYADDVFSVDLAAHTRKWAERFGLEIVVWETFAKGTTDLTPYASRAMETDAQVLMVCGHMDEAVNMCQALKRISWRPAAYYASVGPALHAFYDRCPEEGEGTFGTSLWEPRANFPGAQAFERTFIEKFGRSPGYHAGLAFAGGQVLEEAIREAGGCDGERVRSALFQLDTMTIIGRFGVDATGKQVRQQTFIIQWQHGRKELVWPKRLRTSEPWYR